MVDTAANPKQAESIETENVPTSFDSKEGINRGLDLMKAFSARENYSGRYGEDLLGTV